MQVTVNSPVTGRIVVGREIKRYERGLIIEDAQGVVHYVDFSRVVEGEGIVPVPQQKPAAIKSSVRQRKAEAHLKPTPASAIRTSKYVPKNGVCPVTGRSLNKDGTVRAARNSKKKK